MGTYALKAAYLVPDKKRKLRKVVYLTIARGLSWLEAKKRRNQDRRLSIFPERCV